MELNRMIRKCEESKRVKEKEKRRKSMTDLRKRNKSHDITPLLKSNIHSTRELLINILFSKG